MKKKKTIMREDLVNSLQQLSMNTPTFFSKKIELREWSPIPEKKCLIGGSYRTCISFCYTGGVISSKVVLDCFMYCILRKALRRRLMVKREPPPHHHQNNKKKGKGGGALGDTLLTIFLFGTRSRDLEGF